MKTLTFVIGVIVLIIGAALMEILVLLSKLAPLLHIGGAR